MIEAFVLSFSLILTRTGAFVSVLPLLGGSPTPRTVKAGLALALAVMYFMLLGGSPVAWSGDHATTTGDHATTTGDHATTTGDHATTTGDPATPSNLVGAGPVSWLAFGVVLGKEALLGAFLGYVMSLVLLPVQIAGDYLGQEMGLALAAQADPTATNPSLLVSQLFQMLAGMLFFGLNGHHLFFAALHGTFLRIPLGGWSGLSAAGPMTAGLASAQEWGLMVAAPVGAVLFLTSIVLALMTRAAPHMNLFSIGFALRIGIGLAALFVLLPDFVAALVRAIAHMSDLLERLV